MGARSEPERYDRRELLRRGAVLAGGLTLSESLGLASLLAAERRGPARSVIVLWMAGGPSQLDTWDPKPGRPTAGEIGAIETSVPGIRIAETLPRLAREMHRLALVRSMTSREGNHQRARYLVHTGYAPQGPTAHPSLGALVASALAEQDRELPPFVAIGGPSVGPGFLGIDVAPFVVQDPTRGIDNIAPPRGIDERRRARRWALLETLDRRFVDAHPGPEAAGHRAVVEKAAALMRSASLDAFDLSREPARVREAYGEGAFGQGCLLARRLVERGVPYVEVELGGWDTHVDNFPRTRELAARLDPAMASLVRDLAERGLLETTLVVWMGEFGRTPRINPRGGRDHHPQAWSVVLAGGGIRGGRVVGATDADGVEIRERPVTVPDLFATICRATGIDPDGVHVTPLGRPVSVTDHGRVVEELFT